MTSSDVVVVLDDLDRLGIECWVDGGWGVDALVGAETRPHSDLDLALARASLARAQEALAALGFRPDPEAVPGLPARLVLGHPEHGYVDLHPLVFDGQGNGWQELSAGGRTWGLYGADDLTSSGTIAGRQVRCISPELQLRFRLGYEWSEREEHDLRLLATHFGLPLPPSRQP